MAIATAALPPLLAAWSGASAEHRKGKPPTAAELLGVSKVTVWKLVRDGKLEAVRISPGMTRVKTASLLRLIDEKSDAVEAITATQ
jgi:excisionase family DNA binding protein